MLPSLARTYLVISLSSSPDLLDSFVGNLNDTDPLWSVQPNPDRFSLRDIVAHLATVEQIWLGRVQRILTEENPLFPPATLLDEERVAATPPENLALLHVTRHKIIDAISDMQDSHWLRAARSESLGDLTLESLAVLILAHDGYHLRQINEWLRSAR